MLLYTHLFDSVISRAVKECRKEVQASQIYVLVFGPASTTPSDPLRGELTIVVVVVVVVAISWLTALNISE